MYKIMIMFEITINENCCLLIIIPFIFNPVLCGLK